MPQRAGAVITPNARPNTRRRRGGTSGGQSGARHCGHCDRVALGRPIASGHQQSDIREWPSQFVHPEQRYRQFDIAMFIGVLPMYPWHVVVP